MSMNTYPASGYLISLTQIRAVLERLRNAGSTDARELLLELEADYDYDACDIYGDLVDKWLSTIKCPITVDTPFIADDEQAPELLNGEMYFWIDESDLFVKTDTEGHQKLKNLGLEPELKQWTTFG